MQDCQVCGRSFDPMGFQVVVPELGRGFDRIECAQTARSLATPGSRIAAVPVAAVVAPIPAAAAAPAAGLWSLSTPAATLGFLAAGTAAAAFLWARVLGTDPAAFPFVSADAPPAVAGETVEANAGAEESGGEPGTTVAASPRADTSRPVVISGGSGAGAAPAAAPAARTGGPSGSRGGGFTRNGGGKTKQKSNHGHNGKGHTKHGDTGSNHQPGHGQSQGGQKGSSGASSGHGGGHGKKH